MVAKSARPITGQRSVPPAKKIPLRLPTSALAESGPAAEDHNANDINDNDCDIEPSEYRGRWIGLGRERDGYRHVRSVV